MSAKEVPRAGLLKAVLAGRITNALGATALRMSVRQFQRVKNRFREHGARSLLHQLRGRPGNRHLAPETRAQITTLMTTIYAGFNDVHLTEKLRKVHALPVSRASVRRLRVVAVRLVEGHAVQGQRHWIPRPWSTADHAVLACGHFTPVIT